METNARAHVCTRTHTHTQPGRCLIMQVAVNTSGLLVYPQMCCGVFKENNFKRAFFLLFSLSDPPSSWLPDVERSQGVFSESYAICSHQPAEVGNQMLF